MSHLLIVSGGEGCTVLLRSGCYWERWYAPWQASCWWPRKWTPSQEAATYGVLLGGRCMPLIFFSNSSNHVALVPVHIKSICLDRLIVLLSAFSLVHEPLVGTMNKTIIFRSLSAKPKGPCWFCLGSPEVEKHLVVSVGDQVSYLFLLCCFFFFFFFFFFSFFQVCLSISFYMCNMWICSGSIEIDLCFGISWNKWDASCPKKYPDTPHALAAPFHQIYLLLGILWLQCYVRQNYCHLCALLSLLASNTTLKLGRHGVDSLPWTAASLCFADHWSPGPSLWCLWLPLVLCRHTWP